MYCYYCLVGKAIGHTRLMGDNDKPIAISVHPRGAEIFSAAPEQQLFKSWTSPSWACHNKLRYSSRLGALARNLERSCGGTGLGKLRTHICLVHTWLWRRLGKEQCWFWKQVFHQQFAVPLTINYHGNEPDGEILLKIRYRDSLTKCLRHSVVTFGNLQPSSCIL